MLNMRLMIISLCMILIAACDDSSSSQSCINNTDCPEASPVCNTQTGKCQSKMQDENKCQNETDCQTTGGTCNTSTGKCESSLPDGSKCGSNDDCKNMIGTPVCNTSTGKCVECLLDDDCTDTEKLKCVPETGKCEAKTPDGNACKTSTDCLGTDDSVCNENTGKCVECLRNNDCTNTEKPRCIPETSKCEIATYGKISCQSDADCTDAFHSKCDTDFHECTSPCLSSKDCRICKGDEMCLDSDVPVCNTMKHLCEAYSDCTIHSLEPCYSHCSDDNSEFWGWLNGNLKNLKCRDNSCVVNGRLIGVEPETCEQYSTLPDSCNPESSAMLCSPNGGSIWACDDSSHNYSENVCDPGAHCVQCQKRAGCVPNENCTRTSTQECNSVCNAEGDGSYLWDVNADAVQYHICPQSDCIHVCGTAQCKLGTGYNVGEHCEGAFKYCSLNGAFAFACEGDQIVQKVCKDNDCIYDSDNNEITSCTVE